MSTSNQSATADELIAFMHKLADLGTDVLLSRFRGVNSVHSKPGKNESLAQDVVTEADRAVERAIRDAITQRYPSHGIVGEEFGTKHAQDSIHWTIDPIDGTRAFIAGFPTWGTLIALSESGIPRYGLVNQPYTGERSWNDDSAAYLRDRSGQRRLTTSSCTRLEDAVFSTTDPYLFADGYERDRFEAMRSRARITRYGGDCYAYCLLAAGHVDIVLEAGLDDYDIAALIPIIERAGGIVTTWVGESAAGGGRILACANAGLHAEARALLD